MNVSFCEFVFDFAGFASSKKFDFHKQVTNPSSKAYKNLFAYLTPSDVAWALMIYVDKEDEWKNGKNRQSPTTRAKRKRDATPDKPDKLWTVNAKPMQGSIGFSDEGRAFYSVFKAALKEIPVQEWEVVWTEFWTAYPRETVRKNGRKLNQKNTWDDNDSVIGEDLDESIDLEDPSVMPALPPSRPV